MASISNPWTLAVNGQPAASLDSYGITSPVVRRAGAENGMLTFTLKLDALGGTFLFPYGSSVVLLRNGTPFFIGKVRVITTNFTAGSITKVIQVLDAWWEMSNTVYRQTSVAALAEPYTALFGFLSSRVALNQDAWGRKITLQQQIANATTYCAYNNPGMIGGIYTPASFNSLAEETREVTCAEVIRRACSLNPAWIPFSLYSAGIWQMSWALRGQYPVTIDLAQANLVTGATSLRANYDAVPPGVVIDMMQPVTRAAGSTVTKLNRQSAGFPGRAGSIFATINIGPCDVVPGNLAAAYYQALQSPHWSGSLTVKEQECTGAYTPGSSVNLLGGEAAWASMNAVIKSCEYNLDEGSTVIELGTPDALQVESFVDQLMRFRNIPVPMSYCQVNNNNTEGKDKGVDDEGNETTPPPNQPDPANPDAGGDGVTGPATGNAPGSTPSSNPNQGKPAAAQNTGNNSTQIFGKKDLTLCDGSHVTVLTS